MIIIYLLEPANISVMIFSNIYYYDFLRIINLWNLTMPYFDAGIIKTTPRIIFINIKCVNGCYWYY